MQQSSLWVLLTVLLLVFLAELAVMAMLPWIAPKSLGETGRAVIDALMLTLICAPALLWIIVGPLQRIAQQESLRSETIVANASESILTLDRDGIIRSANRATAELFELPSQQLIGVPLRSFLAGMTASRRDDLWNLPAESKGIVQSVTGRKTSVLISASHFGEGHEALQIIMLRDMTAMEQAEQERLTRVRETEALRANELATLAQLATGVAHEIRNPLTSIKLLIQSNRQQFVAQGFAIDDIQLVEDEIRRMERSINSLLDYARPEVSANIDFDLREAIDRMYRLIAARAQSQDIRVVVTQPEACWSMKGDPGQIQQLLLNLALNAMDAMPEGGELDITLTSSANEYLITVRDHGLGIDPRIQERLFVPFSTTKPHGVGLGLGISRRIAESHGGTLRGGNHPQGGAEFILSLPRPTTTPSPATAKENSTQSIR